MEESKIKITCPNCNQPVSVDDALSQQIESKFRAQLEEESKQKLEIEKKKMWGLALNKADEKLKVESEKVREESAKREKELELLKEELELQKKKREEAEAVELKLRKEKVRLEEDRKAFELEKQRQLDEERAKIREEASKKADEEHRLKEAEWQKRFEDMKKSYDDVKRKLEQGSQQTQGEVLELELEEALKSEFPTDLIEPVPKGINGADIIQNVRDQHGRFCGSIVWESKRTKAWTEGWVQKLKDDQRKVKSEIAILVSLVLPQAIVHFGFHDGIYVSTPEAALNLARILRFQIIKLASAKALEEGKSEKKEVIYNYLCGPEFRGRVEAIVESSVAMRDVLEKEKRALTKIWAEREKQIDRVASNMVGMYGDMQGIAGRALPQIKSLELPSGEEELEGVIVEAEKIPASARMTSDDAGMTPFSSAIPDLVGDLPEESIIGEETIEEIVEVEAPEPKKEKGAAQSLF